MHKLTPVSFSLLTLFIIFISPVMADSVEDRLDRMEKMMGNQVLMEQIQQMDLIRLELTELRELVEGQEHQLTLIKQRQRNLYQDMDRRLQDLEAGSARSTGTATPVLSGSNVPPPVSAGIVAAPSSVQPTIAENTETDDGDGKPAYSHAFNVLKDGDYVKAITEFKNFINTYPESRYAVNAQYWLGEAYYASRDYKSALGVFQGIVDKNPASLKALDAELKIGYTYYAMQDWVAARQALEGLISRHPDAKRSIEKANKRLERMKREGH
ncbi:MAG: tol-pal system protein YbgF [Gammaproteobacteria bacterium]|nr:tol-pal system protein YbgF [Gammaproteobacteria bacterium]MDH5736033.1 tol-pal system protein YbgF [Gammaproteobacteria bacterium]